MVNYKSKDHCFVICAYKESPYLEECIKSIKNQTVKTNVLIETSTPCDYIDKIAKKYKIEVLINKGESGCAQDWNYGFEHAPFKLITIAHQDDIYFKTFAEKTIEYANLSTNPILIYSNYSEIRKNKIINYNVLLIVKNILNGILSNKDNWSKIKKRSFMLSFGDSISCPTVTMNKELVGKRPYNETYICSCDYKTWISLLNKNGDFVYMPYKLMAHRIYEKSHTTKYIKKHIRQKEDKELICSMWPPIIGEIIYFIYSFSQISNNL